jgi:hypothetical protein
MASFCEINIKEGMPTSAEALRYLGEACERLKREKYKCLAVIHGYGSTGKGGVIAKKARSWLKAQEKNGKLKRVIFGEDFELFNFEALRLKGICPELQDYFGGHNHGVTIVEL